METEEEREEKKKMIRAKQGENEERRRHLSHVRNKMRVTRVKLPNDPRYDDPTAVGRSVIVVDNAARNNAAASPTKEHRCTFAFAPDKTACTWLAID